MNTITAFEINEIQLKKLSKNLRLLLDKRRMTESEVAQSLNIPVMTVRRLVSGETTDPRISTLKLIADFFNVGIDSLIEDNHLNTITLMKKSMPQFVPVLDWKLATSIKSINDLDLTLWKDWQPIVLGTQSPFSHETFALESRPSMHPRFPLGTMFIIDPNETPTDGDVILVKMKKDGDLSLRELIIDPPKWQLQPIISGSETLFYDNSNHEIAGVIILTMLHARKNKKAG